MACQLPDKTVPNMVILLTGVDVESNYKDIWTVKMATRLVLFDGAAGACTS